MAGTTLLLVGVVLVVVVVLLPHTGFLILLEITTKVLIREFTIMACLDCSVLVCRY